MNFGKAFTYIFDDPKWLDKIIIPILFSLIPVVGMFVLMGYVLRTTRNVAEGVEYPLPQCDFGDDLALGFKFFVVNLVYAAIPLLLGLLMIPLGIAADNSASTPVLPIIVIILITFLLVLYGIAWSLIMPVVQANFAVKGTIAAGIDIKTIFKMFMKNISAWLLVFAGLIVAGIIAPLGSIALFIGVFITSMYAQLMTAHLAGQAYALTKN
ncbi:MAG TPA: DUF4013 domain-containing protein [Anaerolineaceae bacterium]|nr:DUF4013 domain-containing protein [Anaerolineaceae bacterium]NMD27439.1 DUF4013 domain-containing protein [Chloroflexota bacterium]HOA22044.1 DUF4013 domain-containing protein [Anaerolineaceae bacterium]HOG77690.1 DUF4013 domain-containing protein [Anaerolineaceae bacterium]